MNRLLTPAALLLSFCLASPAFAALKVGDAAPDFTTQIAVGGKTANFTLSEALKHGPVVLYFYPKSFTQGCTVEAHNFAEAADSYAAAGATLIGMSADTIEVQKDFSAKECRDKFPVAADPDSKVIRSYDALMTGKANLSDRISYVIGPDGKILYAYASMSPDKHVENTLAVVQQWHDKH